MPSSLEAELTSELRRWVFARRSRRKAARAFYHTVLADGRSALQDYERAVLEYLCSRFAADATRVVEVGVGYGLLSLMLAAAGFETVAFEGGRARFNGMRHLIATFAEREPRLRSHLHPVRGWFPAALRPGLLRRGLPRRQLLREDRRNVFLSTNIVSAVSAANQLQILGEARYFDDALIDVTRFGVHRYEPGAADAFKNTLDGWFEPVCLAVQLGQYEIWHFRPRAAAGVAAPATAWRARP